jgi:hypothetical protein
LQRIVKVYLTSEFYGRMEPVTETGAGESRDKVVSMEKSKRSIP